MGLQKDFKSIPLTTEEWAQICEPFLKTGRPLEIIDKLREWDNAPVVVKWVGGKDEYAIHSINTALKERNLPFKLVNSWGQGSRAQRPYYTQIHKLSR